MEELAIKIEHVTKQYRLGAIGGGTLKKDLQSWMARRRGKEDPNSRIGSKQNIKVGDRFLALDDINFEVKKGEAVGIIGHNGAGKSTLLKLLSRVTAPTEGKISINGRIASMLEVGTGFHPELTGRENVYMNGAILGMTKAEIDKKFDEIVAFAEMERFIDTPVKRYSSGMYVKLAFAVAAHLDCEIMVMDEVLAVGDMRFQQKCLGKMGDSSQHDGKTVLYVSHNMSTIRQLCTRCIVLDHGHLIYDGDVDTAIGIYADVGGKMEYYYDYSSCPRDIFRARKLEFLNMEILNREKETTVISGEKLNLKLNCKANDNFSNVKIRFEVVASDNTVIGTMFSDFALHGKKGEVFTVNMQLDTEHFAPGTYRFDMLAFESNDFGMQDFTDRIEGAMILEIEKRPTDLEWLPQWWGHVRLTDCHLLSLEKL